MQNQWIKSWVLLLIPVFHIQSCQKATITTDSTCFKAKIVGQICGEAIFEILDSSHYDLGVPWGNSNNPPGVEEKYAHAFHSFLTCTDIEYLSKLAAPTVVGREVSLKLITASTDNTCAVCKATFANIPQKSQMVKFQLDGCK